MNREWAASIAVLAGVVAAKTSGPYASRTLASTSLETLSPAVLVSRMPAIRTARLSRNRRTSSTARPSWPSPASENRPVSPAPQQGVFQAAVGETLRIFAENICFEGLSVVS
jgi:hypothetical protein